MVYYKFLVWVTPDLVESKGLHAGKIAQKLGEFVGGSGGGSATYAEAGAKHEKCNGN